MKLFFALILLTGAFLAHASETHLGVDSYWMSNLLYRANAVPGANLIDDLEKAYAKRANKRAEDLSGYRKANRKATLEMINKLTVAQKRTLKGGEGEKFFGGLIKIVKHAEKENLGKVSLMEKKPELYKILRERLKKTLALPKDAQLPYWRGEENLRNLILDEVSSYESVAAMIGRNWNYSGLQMGLGLDDHATFTRVFKNLPSALKSPRPMTYGGQDVVIPLNLRFDQSCSVYKSQVNGKLSILIMGNSIRLIEDIIAAPEKIDAILKHDALTVSCREVRESRMQTVFNSHQGHFDVNYYYYSGDCYDGCNRFRMAGKLTLQ